MPDWLTIIKRRQEIGRPEAHTVIMLLASHFYPHLNGNNFRMESESNPGESHNLVYIFRAELAVLHVKLSIDYVQATGKLKLWSIEIFSGESGQASLYFWPENIKWSI